ncbi:MAG: DUF4132 domain-containing protein [Lachnospiraceae bacterium]|nr:DUF4132 domain-containing protein [Lachnospiraceae bacterium]
MTSPSSKQISKMTELLKELGVSPHDCELAQSYLSGDAGDEVLDQFERKDLSGSSYQFETKARAVTKQINKADKRAVCARFFNVLYAIGRGSCHGLFWHHTYEMAEECAFYKRLHVLIDSYMAHPNYLTNKAYDHFWEAVQNNPMLLIEAVPDLKKERALYAAVALALYFCKKYENPTPVSKEDTAYMEEYEQILLTSFDEWLAGQGCAAHEEAVLALRQQKPAGHMIGRIEMGQLRTEEMECFYLISSLAYRNCQLSGVLLEIVRACVVINAEETLNTFVDMNETLAIIFRSRYHTGDDTMADLDRKGADYDELFHIEPTLLICWAAWLNYRLILTRQFEKNQESYLKVMEPEECRALLQICTHTQRQVSAQWWGTDIVEYTLNTLKDILQRENPQLYQKLVQDVKQDHEEMINRLVPDTPHAETAREYLRGNCEVSELYPYEKEFGDGLSIGRYAIESAMESYRKHCKDEAFFNRCAVFLILQKMERADCVFYNVFADEAQLKQYFAALDSESLDCAHQLQAFAILSKDNSYYSIRIKMLDRVGEEHFARFLQENPEETLAAFANASSEARALGIRLLDRDAQRYKQQLLGYAKDSSSVVFRELCAILCRHREWEDDIIKLLSGKKASERQTAVCVLSKWQEEGGDYRALLMAALEKEKSANVIKLLKWKLNIKEEQKPKEPQTKEELIQQLHQGGGKRKLAWAYETPFSPVHKTDGTLADEEYLQAVLLCYVEQSWHSVDKNARLLAAELNAAEFAVYVGELFDKWIAAGAEAKKDWVLFAASIHGNEDMLPKLHHQIQEWPKVSRGAIAAEAVRALALNPSPRALLLVDDIARKFKHKQVKNGAVRALDEAAKILGISREELADRIVPDLGFDAKMQRTFDYGARVFKVMLTPSLDIEVFDEDGKKLKNLPAPAKKDDEEKAAEAYAAFKEMKKQMKAAVTSQKARLESALSAKREWDADAWKNLFVGNPLMHQFAIGLIWGVYESGRLTQSFRYMEDGSFNTQDGEEYTMPPKARIGLVHPVELSDEEKAAWKEQLTDYEITQPVEQLDRAVYRMTEEETDSKRLERFGGCVLNDLSLNGKLTALGWYRGSVEDAGGYNTYYREDAAIGLGVKLHFSGSFVGWHEEEVTVYEAGFYKAGESACRSYAMPEKDVKKALYLKDVPQRYFSEIVLQLTKATASCDERETDWKNDAGLSPQ